MDISNICSDAVIEQQPVLKYVIVDEFWVDETQRDKSLSTEFTDEHVIYDNHQKECVVYKNEIICKKMQKKYYDHLKNVCLSLKYLGIDTVLGIVLTKQNVYIFEKVITGFPLICLTSTFDNHHSTTFSNYHRNVKLSIKLTKFLILKMVYDVCTDLEKYHSNGYCHGDVHTGNIMMDVATYKTLFDVADKYENEKLDIEPLKNAPKVFTLIDYDCVFIAPDNKNKELQGNRADYMVKHNRVFHSDKLGDIQRLCSIINLLITTYTLTNNQNTEFNIKTLRLCKKIKKVDSTMSMFATDPLKHFMDNIFVEKSIPRFLFSSSAFCAYLKETYDLSFIFKYHESDNCFYVNTNARKVGKDFWRIIDIFETLKKHNIVITVHYSKEVFTLVIPAEIPKEIIHRLI